LAAADDIVAAVVGPTIVAALLADGAAAVELAQQTVAAADGAMADTYTAAVVVGMAAVTYFALTMTNTAAVHVPVPHMAHVADFSVVCAGVGVVGTLPAVAAAVGVVIADSVAAVPVLAVAFAMAAADEVVLEVDTAASRLVAVYPPIQFSASAVAPLISVNVDHHLMMALLLVEILQQVVLEFSKRRWRRHYIFLYRSFSFQLLQLYFSLTFLNAYVLFLQQQQQLQLLLVLSFVPSDGLSDWQSSHCEEIPLL
jgi:hypothetical protein